MLHHRLVTAFSVTACFSCVDLPRELGDGRDPTPSTRDSGADALDPSLPVVPGACDGQLPGVYCGVVLGLDPPSRYACESAGDAIALGSCATGCVSSSPAGNDRCGEPSCGDAGCATGSAPTNVLAAPGDRFAVVRWTTAVGATQSFTVVASPGGASARVPQTAQVARIDGLSDGTAYTFVVAADDGPPSVPSDSVTPIAGANVIADVPFYPQEHVATCEAAALRMALTHAGASPTEALIMNAIGVDPRAGSMDGGTLSWGDPYALFVGDPNGSEAKLTGYGTYYSTVAAAARSFGATVVQAAEGVPPATLYDAVGHDHPVIAWLSNDLTYHPSVMAWTAFDGRMLEWHGPFEHALVIVGVTPDAVLLDNLHGAEWQWLPKPTFESAYQTFGQMAVIIQ
jgi:uncharacterized protein YvpB